MATGARLGSPPPPLLLEEGTKEAVAWAPLWLGEPPPPQTPRVGVKSSYTPFSGLSWDLAHKASVLHSPRGPWAG